jgi:hypothetical protein
LSSQSNAQVFMRLLNGQSIVPHLIGFFQHSSLSVKKQALTTLSKIIIALSSNNGNSDNYYVYETIEKKENLSLLFRLLYQQAILLSSIQAFEQLESLIEQLWQTMCNRLSIPYLINLCFPYITTWILLMMHSPNQPIDSIYLVKYHSAESLSSSNSGSKEFIGSNQIKFEDKLTKDLIIIKCRLLAVRMLAKLFYRISSLDATTTTTMNTNEKPINVIINFLCTQVNFKSGVQRFCYALLAIEWGKLINNNFNEQQQIDVQQQDILSQLAAKVLSKVQF